MRTTSGSSACARRGVAVWDVLAAGEREGSLDSAIVPASIVVNDFNAFFERHRRIRLICFNGNTAAALFRRKVRPDARTGMRGRRDARAAVDEPGLREPEVRAEARSAGRLRSAISRLDLCWRPWARPTTAGFIVLASQRRPRARACSRFTSRGFAIPTRRSGARRSISAACSSTAAARRPTSALAAGDELEFHRPPWREPEAPESFDVAFEDEHVLVARQAGRPAGAARGAVLGAHAARARARERRVARARRRPRTGSAAARRGSSRSARRALGRSSLTRQLRELTLGKTYLAWVEGARLPGSFVGAAADRARAARPASNPRRGRARPPVADARARAARARANARSSPRSRSRAAPIRSASISRRPARRSSAIRCSGRAACRRATCRRESAAISCTPRGSRSRTPRAARA